MGGIDVPVGPKAGCASRRLPKRCLCVEKGAGPSGDTPRPVASFHPLKRIIERSKNQRCERKHHREDRIPHTGHTAVRASGPLSRSQLARRTGHPTAHTRGGLHTDPPSRHRRRSWHHRVTELVAWPSYFEGERRRRNPTARQPRRTSCCSAVGHAGRWHPPPWRGAVEGPGGKPHRPPTAGRHRCVLCQRSK